MLIKDLIQTPEKVWRSIRWKDGVICACGCKDIYHLGDGRYKCKECRKIFSDTTGTLLHNSKIPTEKWLYAIYKMSTSKGISTMELKGDIEVTYKTAWMMQQKIRYAMNQDSINLSGISRMDEAYIGGWKGMHFKKKIAYMKENGFMDDDWYERGDLMAAVSHKRAHIVSMMDENGRTKILHTPNPITKDVIKWIVERENITHLVTDESKLYQGLNIPVSQSNHSKHIFMTEDGFTSNINENIFSWVKRKWFGIYTHTSQKYLQLYLNQMCFSYNHTGEDKIQRFEYLCALCGNVSVTTEDIFMYDYLEPYKEITDRYQEEEDKALEAIKECDIIVESIKDKYHRTYKPKK